MLLSWSTNPYIKDARSDTCSYHLSSHWQLFQKHRVIIIASSCNPGKSIFFTPTVRINLNFSFMKADAEKWRHLYRWVGCVDGPFSYDPIGEKGSLSLKPDFFYLFPNPKNTNGGQIQCLLLSYTRHTPYGTNAQGCQTLQ